MGKLVITWFNDKTFKVEQITIDDVNLTAEYVDEFGHRTTLVGLYANDQRLVQKDYYITDTTVLRMVKGIDYEKKKQ